MTTFTELFGQLDPDSNIRGKQFERICKWYLEHDPFYASQLVRVWLWKNWPGRWYPRREAGIDLVAQHRDGTLWAIQAKAYDQAYSVTKADVDKFLSESNRKDDKTGRPLFSYRLLLATTRKQLGSTASNTINAQAIPVGYRGRTELDAVEIEWPASPSDLRARRLPPKKPTGHWAYQGEAMEKVVSGFREADRGKLIMACGTGKTLTALFIREKLAVQRTLVLVPSLQLMKQTIGEWTRNKTVDFDFLPVCSDETVSKDDDDMPVSSTSDLGLPVTTAPERIAAFLRRCSGPQVVFATYQSSPEIAKAYRLGRVPAFDLAIADEAHRCAASHSSEFATILDNKKIKAHRRLFMTATPRIYSAHILKTAKEAGCEFASMDDEEKFGKVFHRLTFHEAIERKLLTDYQVAIIGVDNATYREWAEKGWFITIDGEEVKDARSVAGQIGLAKAMRAYDLHRVITFHRLIKGAKDFEASLPDVIDWMPARQRPKGKLWTDHVDGTMSAWERQRRLQRLGDVGKGEHGVISNARCLTEGIDVPTLDGVAFIDPKRSDIDVAQAVGRAIRLADGKTLGTIVIPVFIDTDEPNPNALLEDSAFKPVWDVLLALRSHDEDLAQQLDDLRRMLGRLSRGSRGSLRLPPKIKAVDIPNVCGGEFASAFKVRIIEQTTASWEFWFGLMEKFVDRNRHANVPKTHTEDGYRLGSWVMVQRSAYADGKLDAARELRLKQLPGWTWDARATAWEEGYSRYREYVEQNGHADVPVVYRDADGYRLGQWINVQRNVCANGALDRDRERRLRDLGWVPNLLDAAWEQGYGLYELFVKREGHASVPLSHKEAGFRLGGWVSKQRQAYRKGGMDADREHRLRELGWTPHPYEAAWEDFFRNYRSFVEREGHANVPARHKENGLKLGTWVSNQRSKHARGELDHDREHRLRELGWTPEVWAAAWEEGFRHYQRFVEREGHARVLQQHKEDGYPLGSWVNTQRSQYVKGDLDADRERRLRELGWTPDTTADTAWERGYRHYQRFVEREGHARVPVAHVEEDGYRLGSWVAVQRQVCVKGKLDPERERRLRELGWIPETYATPPWEEGYRRYREYVEQNGPHVPTAYKTADGYHLGQWSSAQRVACSKGELDPERERRLRELGWVPRVKPGPRKA